MTRATQWAVVVTSGGPNVSPLMTTFTAVVVSKKSHVLLLSTDAREASEKGEELWSDCIASFDELIYRTADNFRERDTSLLSN